MSLLNQKSVTFIEKQFEVNKFASSGTEIGDHWTLLRVVFNVLPIVYTSTFTRALLSLGILSQRTLPNDALS